MADLHKKLEDLKEKEKVIKAQQKQVQAQINQKERKERTRRLIKTGAAIEAMMKNYKIEVNQKNIDFVLKYLENEFEKAKAELSESK